MMNSKSQFIANAANDYEGGATFKKSDNYLQVPVDLEYEGGQIYKTNSPNSSMGKNRNFKTLNIFGPYGE